MYEIIANILSFIPLARVYSKGLEGDLMYAKGKYVRKVNIKPKTIRYTISKKTRKAIPFLLKNLGEIRK